MGECLDVDHAHVEAREGGSEADRDSRVDCVRSVEDLLRAIEHPVHEHDRGHDHFHDQVYDHDDDHDHVRADASAEGSRV